MLTSTCYACASCVQLKNGFTNYYTKSCGLFTKFAHEPLLLRRSAPLTRRSVAYFRSGAHSLRGATPRVVMKLQTSAVTPPFTRSEAIPRLVAKSVSRMAVHPWVAVPGITPGHLANMAAPSPCGSDDASPFRRSRVYAVAQIRREQVSRSTFGPTMWGGPRDRIEAELRASSASHRRPCFLSSAFRGVDASTVDASRPASSTKSGIHAV